jgi:hypothetical protein
LIAEKYWLTKVATAVAAGFCAAPAETETDPTVDGPAAGLGAAAADDTVAGGEAESWAV